MVLEVGENTLDSKIRAARNADLTAVLICEKQFQKRKKTNKGQADESPLVQPVSTLADAYDSLLITSAAVAEHKKRICDEWDKAWDPQKTPQAYIDASKESE